MLAEHRIQHSAGWREEFIVRLNVGVPLPICCFKKCAQAVGHRLVRPEHSKVPLFLIELCHVAQERPQHPGIANAFDARRRDVDCITLKIRHPQVTQQQATVGVGIGAHATIALRREFGKFRLEPAVLIEQFLRLVASQPLL